MEAKSPHTVPKLIITFSPEFEVQRLEYTLKKIEWYHSHGYKPSLPLDFNVSDSIPTNEQIVQLVHSEYDASLFETQKKYLEANWPFALKQKTSQIDKILPFLNDEYYVYLTRYGTGGSYDYPNTIYANITYWWETGIVRNILHEVTHLAIHPLIEKYKIDHWRKERLVDLITLRLSERYGRTQEIKENVSMVDEMFERFYPDTSAVITHIAQLSTND